MSVEVLLTELYPSIEATFKDKRKTSELEKIIGKFFDRNIEKLSAIGPTKMILFTDNDRLSVYNLVGVNETFVKSLKGKMKDSKSKWAPMVDPFNSLMPMIIRYFIITKNQKMVSLCTSYLGLSIYPLLYYKYFKYEPNENIMNYTINELSQKYKIKQTGNLLGAVNETVNGALELHRKDLVRGRDSDVVDFILAVRTRLNSMLKKIAVEFYKHQQQGNYLNIEHESNEEEDYREADSTIYAINKIVDNVTLKLIVQGPPINLISVAARNNQVSINELRNYINTMLINSNKDDIRTIVESILFVYLITEKNSLESINSSKFLIHCLDVYKRSNTTDENIVRIKTILDKWLEELGTYKKTQRLATINSFRRALYTFFVISIQYYSR